MGRNERALLRPGAPPYWRWASAPLRVNYSRREAVRPTGKRRAGLGQGPVAPEAARIAAQIMGLKQR